VALTDNREAALAGADIARLVEFTEAAAYADMLRAAPPAWQCVEERSPDGWLLLAPRLDILLFNRLVGCGLDAPATRAGLHGFLDTYRAAGLRNFGVQASPVAQPADLARWLAEEGMAPRDRWTKVYRAAGPSPEPATDLRIERVGPEHASAVAKITCAVFGMPPWLEPWIESMVGRANWHHYLAWQGDEAVATAALFVHGGVGWLGAAGTMLGGRRRGAQSSLMARRLQDGCALACRWFVTETGEDSPERPNSSFHNMMRAGFVVAYHRPNFLRIG
jgi:hypothetical protein